jgi:Tfp pilus assembly protein FimT
MNPLNPLTFLSIFRRIPRSDRHGHRGQGMTEYLIVVALIAVAAIGVYTLLGQTIRNQTAGLALEVSGQDAASAISGARSQANTAQSQAATRKGLDNYNADNR